MLHNRRNQRGWLMREEPQQSIPLPHHAPLSPPKPEREDAMGTASLSHLTGVRAIILSVVLLVVALGMLVSFVFLFTDGRPRLPLLPLPSSWSLPGLIGVGGGVVVLLWITLTSLLTGALKQRSAVPPDHATRGAMTPCRQNLGRDGPTSSLLCHVITGGSQPGRET